MTNSLKSSAIETTMVTKSRSKSAMRVCESQSASCVALTAADRTALGNTCQSKYQTAEELSVCYDWERQETRSRAWIARTVVARHRVAAISSMERVVICWDRPWRTRTLDIIGIRLGSLDPDSPYAEGLRLRMLSPRRQWYAKDLLRPHFPPTKTSSYIM